MSGCLGVFRRLLPAMFVGSAFSFGVVAAPAGAATPVFTQLYSFDGTSWAAPNAVIQGPGKSLIGTAFDGGPSQFGCSTLGCGGIFQWFGQRNATQLHDFTGSDGGSPATGLILGPVGTLYGTTYYGGNGGAGFGTVFSLSGTTLNTIYTFSGLSDGANPNDLMVANDGNLYGTTSSGGSGAQFGTVFRLTPSGTLTTLKRYNHGGPQGIIPVGIMQAKGGNFYGIVEQSGNTNTFGAAFRLTTTGAYTTLHTFVDADGGFLQSGLIQASDGNFYGVAAQGGTAALCPENFAPGCGTIYRLTSTGKLTVLHAFNLADGQQPYGKLLQAGDGFLYGTTSGGGPNKCPVLHIGCGTIFRVDLAGGKFSTLYNFHGRDGSIPLTALIQGSDGALYGTTSRGGRYGFGTLFRITRP